MMSMMENYFSIWKDSRALFEGLAISKQDKFCQKWMNQYPVLYISFKDVEGKTYEGAYQMLTSCLADVCKGLESVVDVTKVNQADAESFRRLMFEEAKESEVKNSLKIVTRMLHTLYRKKVILFFLWNTISYNDYHEDYYHAFLAGIFVGRGYEVESNKEKGFGRPDILLLDRANRRAIIVEAEVAKRQEDMDMACDKAIKQIVDAKYAEGVIGYEQVLCYGIAFYQKQAKIKLLKKI
ncbi:Predicted AAA-ATPase [Lachnospiraceae bacterium XBB1006]|nr:Predicted AAA-ATPase [Lachnospiraceae bacterium XBB1006]